MTDQGSMQPGYRARAEAAEAALARVKAFMATVHGINEMSVIRGLRKVIVGEESTFEHEVKLTVWGAPCGHPVPDHYPQGYGECEACEEARLGHV